MKCGLSFGGVNPCQNYPTVTHVNAANSTLSYGLLPANQYGVGTVTATHRIVPDVPNRSGIVNVGWSKVKAEGFEVFPAYATERNICDRR